MTTSRRSSVTPPMPTARHEKNSAKRASRSWPSARRSATRPVASPRIASSSTSMRTPSPALQDRSRSSPGEVTAVALPASPRTVEPVPCELPARRLEPAARWRSTSTRRFFNTPEPNKPSRNGSPPIGRTDHSLSARSPISSAEVGADDEDGPGDSDESPPTLTQEQARSTGHDLRHSG